jgi:hypothetical protein
LPGVCVYTEKQILRYAQDDSIWDDNQARSLIALVDCCVSNSGVLVALLSHPSPAAQNGAPGFVLMRTELRVLRLRATRFAQDDKLHDCVGESHDCVCEEVGGLLSHPFAEYAKGWGTRRLYCYSEKADPSPSFLRVRMTTSKTHFYGDFVRRWNFLRRSAGEGR